MTAVRLAASLITSLSARGPLRVSGQAVLRQLRHPGLARRGGHHGGRRGRGGRSHRLSRRGQGTGPGRRTRQSRRRQTGRRRRVLQEHASNILGLDIKGHIVKVLWIEQASDIAEEYYASFTLDRAAKQHLGLLSAKGGVEIETVAAEDPDAIARISIDPVDGLSEARARSWVEAAKLNPAGDRWRGRASWSSCIGLTSKAMPTSSRSTR